MIIPFEELQPDTLRALIEEFVSRQGAVHGHGEVSLDRQIEQVTQQLRHGRAVIVFDEEDETCSILTKEEARRRPPDDPSEPRMVYDEP